MATDERFEHVSRDPKFRHIPKEDKKVKIDKRFHGMFKDEKFKVKYTVDKRGRPINHLSSNDLKRYYNISSESEDSDNEIDESLGKYVRAPKPNTDNDLNLLHEDSEIVSENIKKKLKNLNVDYARGEGCLNTDSSSEDEESEEASEESDIEHGWGELDRDAETTNEITRRLAVCNMDWDRIRAVDLMVLFNSFLPAGSHIESISIYPSEFGLQRMKEEEVKGPTELVQSNNKQKFDENETEEGSKYHMEKLRQYQLNRLKYYYAVIVLDNKETANKLYTECDGLEYESSATKIDLRFIPEDTSFDYAPKEICDKLPDMTKYQPRFFTTTALQQAKVDLTWDETNPSRLEIAKKLSDGKVEDVTDADLQAYLASSSSEQESEDEDYSSNDQNNEQKFSNPIEKYRALLNDLETTNDDKKGVEMEVTWELNSKNNTEKMVQKKLSNDSNKTPFQQYLQKQKDKRKIKRQERKKQMKNNSEESDIDIDMSDPYFAEEFQNADFKKEKNDSEKKIENDQEKAQLELLLLDNDHEKEHFSIMNEDKIENSVNIPKKKTKKHKNKGKTETIESSTIKDDFKVDVNDARFSAIFTSHHYNIDPTDPSYRKTEAMKTLIEEKQKRINQTNTETTQKLSPPNKKAKHAELNALISSVKRKTKNIKKN